MKTANTISYTPVRAASREELAPLIDFVKRGCLYDVEAWIAAGKPVNPPETPPKRPRIYSPLFHAIEAGFHTLIAVLLKGGAAIEYHRETYTSVGHAARKRRQDLVKLLIEYGADARRTPVEEAFDSWNPEIIDFFIEHGADMETAYPLAKALSAGIRPALGTLMKYRDRFPSFQEQANIALRYHCTKGRQRWVALLLWAGADPFVPGEDEINAKPIPDEPGLTAVEFAALYDHHELFALPIFKKIFKHSGMRGVLAYPEKPRAAETIRAVLKAGLIPNDQANGGSSAVQKLLEQLTHCQHIRLSVRSGLDTVDHARVRASLASLKALIEYGALWRPQHRSEVFLARKGLRFVTTGEAEDFVITLCFARACSREAFDLLLGGDVIFKVLHAWRKIESMAKMLPSYPVPKGPDSRRNSGAEKTRGGTTDSPHGRKVVPEAGGATPAGRLNSARQP